MNINELGARIDRPTIRELIAYATCRNRPFQTRHCCVWKKTDGYRAV